MNKICKFAFIPLALLLGSQLQGCNIPQKEVALICDVSDIDDGSFNQTTWEAMKKYCEENGKTYDYYRPFMDSNYARECATKQAIIKGAKFIVYPGYKFSKVCREVSEKYPDIHTIIVDPTTSFFCNDDGKPATPKNCTLVSYKAEVSGYLAGYAAVSDYLLRDFKDEGKVRDKYGFGYAGGMANDGTLQFGFGFIQGISYGCIQTMRNEICPGKDLKDIKFPEIDINFKWAHVYGQDSATCAAVKGWYGNGCNAVFACGGRLYQSIVEAAKSYNQKKGYYKKLNEEQMSEYPDRECARWIGVDNDQYIGSSKGHDKNTIMTSALKGLGTAVEAGLDCYYNNAWDEIGGNPDSSRPDHVVGLQTKYGRTTQDFVGIPVVYDETTNIMRGFKYYTFDMYKKSIAEISGDGAIDFVYTNNASDIYEDENCTKLFYEKDGKFDEQGGKGNPNFYDMISSDKKDPIKPSYVKINTLSGEKKVDARAWFLRHQQLEKGQTYDKDSYGPIIDMRVEM